MKSVPISHSITGPLARSIGPGFTGAERGKALTNAGGLSGPPFGVHYSGATTAERTDGNRVDTALGPVGGREPPLVGAATGEHCAVLLVGARRGIRHGHCLSYAGGLAAALSPTEALCH